MSSVAEQGLATPSEPPKASEPAGDLITLDLITRTLPRRSLISYLIFFWMHRFTAGGRALLFVTLVLGMAAAANIQYPVNVLATFFIVVLLVDAFIGFVFRPRVEIKRRLPDRCAADASVRVTAEVKNVGWLSCYTIAVRELSSPWPLILETDMEYLDVLPRGESAKLNYTVHPTRRGAYDFSGPEICSAFPFGLYNSRRKTKASHRMLVYPRFKPLQTFDVPTGRRHQPGGLELVSAVGDSEEFVGLREYRPGDRLRDLHHQAWARHGRPIVREYNQEYLTRIAMAVDTFRPRRTLRGTRAVEAVISLSAAVADALAREEYVVDIFAAGPELYHFQAGRSLAFLDDILDVLACVEECRDDPFPKLGPALLDEIGQISTVICVLLDWDESRQSFVREIESRGALAMVIVVRDGPTTVPTEGFTSGAGAIKRFTSAQVEEGVEAL